MGRTGIIRHSMVRIDVSTYGSHTSSTAVPHKRGLFCSKAVCFMTENRSSAPYSLLRHGASCSSSGLRVYEGRIYEG